MCRTGPAGEANCERRELVCPGGDASLGGSLLYKRIRPAQHLTEKQRSAPGRGASEASIFAGMHHISSRAADLCGQASIPGRLLAPLRRKGRMEEQTSTQ